MEGEIAYAIQYAFLNTQGLSAPQQLDNMLITGVKRTGT